MRIIVSGSLAYDRIMDFPGRFRDHILPGKIHLLNLSFAVRGLTEHFGGTAGNIAYSLAQLGARPTVVASAGHDFGPYRKWLGKLGVDLAGVRVVAGERTAAAYIITDRDDNQITGFHIGAMAERGVVPAVRDLRRAACAVVSPGNLADMRTLPVRYRRYGVPYWFDPGQQLTSLSGAVLRVAISGSAGLFVNDYELSLVQKKTSWKIPALLGKTRMLVTTFGPKGSEVRTGGTRLRVRAAKPRKVVDPTGAGDAYRAGFLYGYLQRWPLKTAAQFAGVVAVYTVERAGTQTHRFTWADLRRRYRENFQHPLPS